MIKSIEVVDYDTIIIVYSNKKIEQKNIVEEANKLFLTREGYLDILKQQITYNRNIIGYERCK